MKLQFKHQKFQEDAAQAVVSIFAGQPYSECSYLIDPGKKDLSALGNVEFTGWRNVPVVPELTDDVILERIQKLQRAADIEPSRKLQGRYNLTIEMETGVGKTYTYIKTMYELNRHYGWTKFIVVVPSIAIREGVYKSFQITQDHFSEEYGKKIKFFIYDSKRLNEIENFAQDNFIHVMIINAQAFNATGKDARRIDMKLDEFRSRKPIDVIAQTNPILIIDEPQSVEGPKTKEGLKRFRPLMTLRYSATHKSNSIYNMIFRLDAMEAYNKRLVKKIAVKGISQCGTTATNGYVYLESVNLSEAAPTATLHFDFKGASGIRQKKVKVSEGYDLYAHSGELEEYRDGYVVTEIDGRDNHIEFRNGLKLYAGEASGHVSEEQLRRLQIRETIQSHIERERSLFRKGIKVLSLFFIDEVAKYRQYDEAGQAVNGLYAQMFEEEYADILREFQLQFGEESYARYLEQIEASQTHAGYFSIDKGKMIDCKRLNKKERTSNDAKDYELIMKNKELLLNRDPKKSPVRFIFSHSALREGWDNPNVFQICTLKQSSSEVRKRQEVGRGLRLCVNQEGIRMDTSVLGEDIHDVNVLTVIASESYDSFAKGLQNELAEAVGNRPIAVTPELFKGKILVDSDGNEQVADEKLTNRIFNNLIRNDYIDDDGKLTDRFYEDKKNGTLVFSDQTAEFKDSILKIIDTIYDSRKLTPENARRKNVEQKVDMNKLAMPEFKSLWEKINSKSVYVVDFDSDELIRKSIAALDRELRVSRIYFNVETGEMKEIRSKDALLAGTAFSKSQGDTRKTQLRTNRGVKYDLLDKLVQATGLTRKAVAQILTGIKPETFGMFRENPEEFIQKTAHLINSEKATVIVNHITYHVLDEKYSTDIFTEPGLKGQLDVNARKSSRHLFDHVLYDSEIERKFSEELDRSQEVVVYVKLPGKFYISTPVGKYNPDWAIAFREGHVKHIYFVAETKGSMDSMELRQIEKTKIDCARAHFRAVSRENVTYEVIDSYQELMNLVKNG